MIEETSNDEPPTEQESPPRRSRLRRWGRRFLIAALVLFVLGNAAILGFRQVLRIEGNRKLAEITTHLDREEPGWHLNDIEAARERAAPPDSENSSLVVEKVLKLIPKNYQLYNSHERPPELNPPSNHRLQPEELLSGPHTDDTPWMKELKIHNKIPLDEPFSLGNLVESTSEARTLARSLRKLPPGYRKLDYPDVPLLVDLKELQQRRSVAALLQDDALLAAHNNDPTTGLQAAHATLNTGRSIGDEPVSISQLVRIACGTIGAASSIRVLALTDPKKDLPELRELQIAFMQEAEVPILLYSLRGERAMMDIAMENMENGKFAKYYAEHPEDKDLKPLSGVGWFFRGIVPGDRASGLELMTKAIAVANLPAHQQIEAMKALEMGWRELHKDTFERIRHPLTPLLAPATVKLTVAAIRYKANLVTAATAIACERFRLSHGRWPTSLEELPKELLPAIPADPFNGKPIELHKLDDGIAIMSVGMEEESSYGKKARVGPLGGVEYGWRLFNPDQRGLPPLPRKKGNDSLEP